MSEQSGGDHIQVGDISGAQGIAIGRGAQANVTGSNVAGEVDTKALRAALEELHAALGLLGLPPGQVIAAQTAVGNALGGVQDEKVEKEAVVSNLEKVRDTLKDAQVVVEEGTSLWQSLQKLAPLVGPLVGGARLAANVLGIPV